VDNARVKIKGMTENIQEISFDVFQNWKYRVNQDYPDKQIQILDERELTTDVQNAIYSALKALSEEKKKPERKDPGYDYGFFSCGLYNLPRYLTPVYTAPLA
jgi:hypothetical protein